MTKKEKRWEKDIQRILMEKNKDTYVRDGYLSIPTPLLQWLTLKNPHLWDMAIFPTSLENRRGHITNEMVMEGEGSRKGFLKRAERPLYFPRFQWPECKHGTSYNHLLTLRVKATHQRCQSSKTQEPGSLRTPCIEQK